MRGIDPMSAPILAALIAFLLAAVGCGSGAEARLLLYCGAGIRPPVDELVRLFEEERGISIKVDYAGSEVLLSKVKLSEKGDLYLPGDRHYVDQAEALGMIAARKRLFFFAPTILVAKGNPREIAGLDDLLDPRIRLGLGDPRSCAIGRKTRKLFALNGISWEKVLRNVTYQAITVTDLGAQIQARSLDAVVVWDATARYFGRHGDEVPIPNDRNIISAVHIGLLAWSEEQAAAMAFIDFAVSERGIDLFRRHNYRTTRPDED